MIEEFVSFFGIEIDEIVAISWSQINLEDELSLRLIRIEQTNNQFLRAVQTSSQIHRLFIGQI